MASTTGARRRVTPLGVAATIATGCLLLLLAGSDQADAQKAGATMHCQPELFEETCGASTSSVADLDGLDGPDGFDGFDSQNSSAEVGRWGPVIDTPLIPVAASALPNGKVMMWSAWRRYDFGGENGYTQTSLFDPATNTSTLRQVSNTGHDMFCPGIANLADGRVLVNGGSDAAETSIYNPATDSWENAADMNIARGYNATTLLSDGSAFTLGGSWSGGLGNKNAERWTAASGWESLSGVPAAPFQGNDPQGVYRSDNHMWLFAWKDRTIFHAGPSRNMHWIDTNGSGSYSSVGLRASDAYAMNGNAVMYAPGKILTNGGAPGYTGNVPATANATVIDITGSTVTARAVSSMANPRVFQSSTVLPNGQVLVTGGQEQEAAFSDSYSVLTPELWDPETETFQEVAPMTVPRNYHSVGLLLPDATVMVGGGGLCGDHCDDADANHPDVQIYSPPYLFNADGSEAGRPGIASAPDQVDPNQRFTATTDRPVAEFALVRTSAATHAVNLDQRRIPLTPVSSQGNSYELLTPADPGVIIPGTYMLFAIDAQGVPSVSKFVRVTDQPRVDRDGDGVADSEDAFPDDPTEWADTDGDGMGDNSDPFPNDPERPGNRATIGGTVTSADGRPVAQVDVDLFQQANGGGRGPYLTSSTTDTDGLYRFGDLDPDCYVVTFIATDGERFDNGTPWQQAPACVDSGQQQIGIDAALARSASAGGLTGTITFDDAAPVEGVLAVLYQARADGSRGTFLAVANTDATGIYQFATQPGCFVVDLVAPDGASFGGRQYYQLADCVADGNLIDGLDAILVRDSERSQLTGSVQRRNDSPVAGVGVDLFTTAADGSRGTYLNSTVTDENGSFSFNVDAACHTLTFIAPDGLSFNGSRWFQPTACPQADGTFARTVATLS